MAKIVFAMNQSLDGYVDHDAFAPDPVLFRHFIDDMRNLAGCVYGRRLYEIMSYWDHDDWNQHDPARISDLRDFALAWRRQTKWVVSRTLKSVGPNAALVEGDIETAIRKLKAERTGDIEVGGPNLAGQLTKLGLIDEYRLYLHPVVLGRGSPLFTGPRPRLRLVTSERIGEDVIKLTYVPA
jgi:dihydrofolate reductase